MPMVTSKAKLAPKKNARKTASGATVGRPRGSTAATTAEYNRARAAHKSAQAELALIEVRQRAGELIPAAEVAQAVSIAFAAITQDLLSIPDKLERLHGVAPDVALKVDDAICAAIEGLRKRLATLEPEPGPKAHNDVA